MLRLRQAARVRLPKLSTKGERDVTDQVLCHMRPSLDTNHQPHMRILPGHTIAHINKSQRLRPPGYRGHHNRLQEATITSPQRSSRVTTLPARGPGTRAGSAVVRINAHIIELQTECLPRQTHERPGKEPGDQYAGRQPGQARRKIYHHRPQPGHHIGSHPIYAHPTPQTAL